MERKKTSKIDYALCTDPARPHPIPHLKFTSDHSHSGNDSIFFNYASSIIQVVSQDKQDRQKKSSPFLSRNSPILEDLQLNYYNTGSKLVGSEYKSGHSSNYYMSPTSINSKKNINTLLLTYNFSNLSIFANIVSTLIKKQLRNVFTILSSFGKKTDINYSGYGVYHRQETTDSASEYQFYSSRRKALPRAPRRQHVEAIQMIQGWMEYKVLFQVSSAFKIIAIFSYTKLTPKEKYPSLMSSFKNDKPLSSFSLSACNNDADVSLGRELGPSAQESLVYTINSESRKQLTLTTQQKLPYEMQQYNKASQRSLSKGKDIFSQIQLCRNDKKEWGIKKYKTQNNLEVKWSMRLPIRVQNSHWKLNGKIMVNLCESSLEKQHFQIDGKNKNKDNAITFSPLVLDGCVFNYQDQSQQSFLADFEQVTVQTNNLFQFVQNKNKVNDDSHKTQAKDKHSTKQASKDNNGCMESSRDSQVQTYNIEEAVSQEKQMLSQRNDEPPQICINGRSQINQVTDFKKQKMVNSNKSGINYGTPSHTDFHQLTNNQRYLYQNKEIVIQTQAPGNQQRIISQQIRQPQSGQILRQVMDENRNRHKDMNRFEIKSEERLPTSIPKFNFTMGSPQKIESSTHQIHPQIQQQQLFQSGNNINAHNLMANKSNERRGQLDWKLAQSINRQISADRFLQPVISNHIPGSKTYLINRIESPSKNQLCLNLDKKIVYVQPKYANTTQMSSPRYASPVLRVQKISPKSNARLFSPTSKQIVYQQRPVIPCMNANHNFITPKKQDYMIDKRQQNPYFTCPEPQSPKLFKSVSPQFQTPRLQNIPEYQQPNPKYRNPVQLNNIYYTSTAIPAHMPSNDQLLKQAKSSSKSIGHSIENQHVNVFSNCQPADCQQRSSKMSKISSSTVRPKSMNQKLHLTLRHKGI